ncbi:hypothetical protein CYLTODRAFT_491309 [Cylindrobasidium torrendii FP15055 ss-10]|uniref:Uncharacterized protein n=1 Tax=Cylindrobasidium torrendii FP15055 ss-10 TaxID=1314674 RepID=A0A0D7B7W9_9AGAR|nr:hypothetical protein CYLTODRAFT_491309 [Cylindrobasidium torrendii FP15055 ss-10]
MLSFFRRRQRSPSPSPLPARDAKRRRVEERTQNDEGVRLRKISELSDVELCIVLKFVDWEALFELYRGVVFFRKRLGVNGKGDAIADLWKRARATFILPDGIHPPVPPPYIQEWDFAGKLMGPRCVSPKCPNRHRALPLWTDDDQEEGIVFLEGCIEWACYDCYLDNIYMTPDDTAIVDDLDAKLGRKDWPRSILSEGHWPTIKTATGEHLVHAHYLANLEVPGELLENEAELLLYMKERFDRAMKTMQDCYNFAFAYRVECRSRDIISRFLAEDWIPTPVKGWLEAADPVVLRNHPFFDRVNEMTDTEWKKSRANILDLIREITPEDFDGCAYTIEIASLACEIHRRMLTVLAIDEETRQFCAADRTDLRSGPEGLEFCLPSPDWIFRFPEFHRILLADFPSVPLLAAFDSVFEVFPSIFANWKMKRMGGADSEPIRVRQTWMEYRWEGLVRILDQDGIFLEDQTLDEKLESAMTVFQCNCCDQPVWYPNALTHWCEHMWTAPNGPAMDFVFPFLCQDAWSKSEMDMKVFPDGSLAARYVIEAIQENQADWETNPMYIFPSKVTSITAKEMDRIGGFFSCDVCVEKGIETYIMTWREAVYHGATEHGVAAARASKADEVCENTLEPDFLPDMSFFHLHDEMIDWEKKIRGYNGFRDLGLQAASKDLCQIVCTHCNELYDIAQIRPHVRFIHDKETFEPEDFTVVPSRGRFIKSGVRPRCRAPINARVPQVEGCKGDEPKDDPKDELKDEELKEESKDEEPKADTSSSK